MFPFFVVSDDPGLDNLMDSTFQTDKQESLKQGMNIWSDAPDVDADIHATRLKRVIKS